MKSILLPTLVILFTHNYSFSQDYMEGVDLPGTGTGPAFTVGGPTTTIAGTLNTPGDSQDRFQIVIPSGCSITSVTYSITDLYSISVTGHVQFGAGNQQSLPPLTNSFSNGPAGSFPVDGPGTFDCAIVANIAANDQWAMMFHNDCAATQTEELEESENISCFPNPVNNQLNINIEAKGKIVVQITDISGRIVRAEEPVWLTGNVTLNYDISNFNPGIYFLQLQNGEKLETVKIVKR